MQVVSPREAIADAAKATDSTLLIGAIDPNRSAMPRAVFLCLASATALHVQRRALLAPAVAGAIGIAPANAGLIDFDPRNPIEILKRLMIGSEGTLGFVSQVTYHTVPEHPHKASAFLVF